MIPETKRSRERRSSVRRDKDWRLPSPLDPVLVDGLCREAGVIPEVASILLRRSGNDPVRALSFLRDQDVASRSASLSGLPGFPGASVVPGMQAAVDRIAAARESGERVVVYSDFDCDGVTSAAVLKEALEQAGFDDFEVYFPSRIDEGYGFHAGSAVALAERGASLFITCDCGISGLEACEALASLGRDVIVTDHHLPGLELPAAVAVLDPHLPSWASFGLEGLSGAGVAYMLSVALFERLGVAAPGNWAHDLLTLSIAGDGQPVLGLNRALIRSGLASLTESDRPGIRALARVAGLGEAGGAARKMLSFDRDVTFGLVPRINAAGRLADPRLAFDLLCTGDPLRAEDLAQELDALNRQRKEIEDAILEGCWEDLSGDKYALCAFRPGWHEGVIGIACSRVREAFGRPAVLVGGEGDLLKGSVRGVPGFNVCGALAKCGALLAAYGGHEAAGGFSIKKENVDRFFEEFDRVSAEMLRLAPAEGGAPVDEVLPFSRITEDNLRAFYGLEPFGDSNPIPQVACADCEVAQVGLMGSAQDHLQIALSKDGTSRRFLWFGQGKAARDIAVMGRVDALFAPYRSTFRGQEQLSPLLRDLRPAWSSSGLLYADLAKKVPRSRPVIIYTWSEGAAESLWTALRKEGRVAGLHRAGERGGAAREPGAVLAGPDGVVVSLAPWDLAEQGALLTVLHPPLEPEDREALDSLARRSGGLESVPGDSSAAATGDGLIRDADNWLAWTHPEKDRLRALWKFLTHDYQGGRVPLVELGRQWQEVLDCAGFPAGDRCSEGGRLLLTSALRIFEEVSLATYDQSRRAPEMVLRTSGPKVSLEGSQTFMAGERLRAARASLTWRV